MNEVAVVGAGILGAFTALALQERGAKTILIERGQIALGTTSNSFAWVNATAKTGHEAYHRLNAAGVKAWHDLASEFGDRTVGLYGAGSLHWGDPEIPGSLEGHRNRVAALRAFDYPVFELSRRDLQALEPDIRFGEDAEGLMAPVDRWADAPRAARFAVDRFRSLGGEVREQTAVSGFSRTGGRVDGLETSAGHISVGNVVIAAGVDAGPLIALAAGIGPNAVPLSAVPGLIVETPPQADRALVRHVIYPADPNGFHLRPTPSGGLSIGGDDVDAEVGFGEDPDRLEAAIDTLLQRAHLLLPSLAAEELRAGTTARVGARPMPADDMSIVGALPGADGVFVVVTHSGVTLAPALGPLLADAITGGAVPEVLHPFQPSRFASLAA